MQSAPKRQPVQPDTLLDNMTTAVISLDGTLAVDALNPAAEVLFGVSARHAMGLRAERAVPALAAQAERLQQALADGTAYTERELRLTDHHGDTLTVDCSVTPFRSGSGPALVLEFLPMDRHLRISRDDRMRSQNLANREMLRGLAHEIKNPLGGLRGAAQLLEREVVAPELAEYTGVIIREADRLQNLVDHMLGPRKPPEFVRQNIHEALEHVRRLIETDLPDGVRLVRDYDPSVPELDADREQLIQVFFNLIGNAAQAIGDDGTITLRTRAQRLFTIGGVQHRLVLRVDVIDTGSGIDEDLLPRIFLPMVTARAEGSGMGLPIAQYLVHLHSGLIECDSRPGETVFSVFLPLRAGHE